MWIPSPISFNVTRPEVVNEKIVKAYNEFLKNDDSRKVTD